MPVTSVTAGQLLQEARDWLAEDPRRWIQQATVLRAHDSNEAVAACAIGAVNMIAKDRYGLPLRSEPAKRAWRLMAKATGLKAVAGPVFPLDLGAFATTVVVHWNDAYTRTYEEVLDMFDAAMLANDVTP